LEWHPYDFSKSRSGFITGFHRINQSQAGDHLICSMRPDERERMYHLCALIEKEKDHHRFLKLIEELNELLERQEQRLGDKPPTSV
jgi:hypothetical protein